MGKKRRNKRAGYTSAADDYSQFWNAQAAPMCHKSPKLAFTLGNLYVYGSKGQEVWRGDPWDLQVPCLEDLSSFGPSIYVESNLTPTLEKFIPKFVYNVPPDPYIHVIWKDGSVPFLTMEWWYALAQGLKEAAEEKKDRDGKPFKVIFYCFGGHGRTGTAMSIIASLLGLVPEGECPVGWLRKKYCKDIVETKEQIAYVAKITEREVTATGSWASYSLSAKAETYGPATVGPGTAASKTAATNSGASSIGKAENTAKRYQSAMTPFSNKTMGAVAPKGFMYILLEDGSCGLEKVSSPGAGMRLEYIAGRGLASSLVIAECERQGLNPQTDRELADEIVVDPEDFESKFEGDHAHLTAEGEVVNTPDGGCQVQGDDGEMISYTYDPDTGEVIVKKSKPQLLQEENPAPSKEEAPEGFTARARRRWRKRRAKELRDQKKQGTLQLGSP